jgi:hypothetical protein
MKDGKRLTLHPDPLNHEGSWDLKGVLPERSRNSKIRLDQEGNVLPLKGAKDPEKNQIGKAHQEALKDIEVEADINTREVGKPKPR